MHLNGLPQVHTLFIPSRTLNMCNTEALFFGAFPVLGCWIQFGHPIHQLGWKSLVNSWRAFVEVKNKEGNLSLQVSGLLTLCFSFSPSRLFDLSQPPALPIMCMLWLELHIPGTAQRLK